MAELKIEKTQKKNPLDAIADAQKELQATQSLLNQSVDNELHMVKKKSQIQQDKIEKSHLFASKAHYGAAVASALTAGLGLALEAKGITGAIAFCGNLQNLPSTAIQAPISSNQAEQTKWQSAQRASQLEEQSIDHDKKTAEQIATSSRQTNDKLLEQFAQAMMR